MTPDLLSPSETLFTLMSALIIIPIIFGFVFKAPSLVALGFIAVLFSFSDSSWGQLQSQGTIYSRGVGIFYFSLLNLVLLVSGTALLIKRLANRHNPAALPVSTPMAKYFIAFIFLLLAHIVIGLIAGIDLNVILGYRGIINIFNMMIFMYLIIMAFQNDRDTTQLLLIIILLAVIRAVFGLVRYAWFGGDTANPYRNLDGLDIKIVYFDIGDNFVASLAAFCSAWLMTSSEIRLSIFTRVLLCGFVLLEIAAVALSFRRASLIGLGLMFVLLLVKLPPRKRLFFALFATGLLCGIAVVFFQNRLQFNSSGNILDALLFDVSPDRNPDDSRFYELYAAGKSIGDNWLIGLGAWGKFDPDYQRLEYHMGDFSFVHSGFGHVILKTGLIGFVLFSCILIAYVAYYFKTRKQLVGKARLLADAGFGGFLFWIPTLLIGTPIIEFRTMLLIGLTLALPFVAVGLQNYQIKDQARSYHAAA